jgi:glutaredoxin
LSEKGGLKGDVAERREAGENSMNLILYSKPGCHLCEGLQAKLEQVHAPKLELEVRDITSRDDWFQAYQYEVPVLFLVGDKQNGMDSPPAPTLLPRLSPRASVQQVEQLLQKYCSNDSE